MPEVLIIGAGLAGLACAREATRLGVSCRVLEASDAVGGRARTDVIDGFLLDRGFQVLLTAYPEAQRMLNYPALQLRSFAPGALVRFEGRFHRVVDPWRRPSTALTSLVSPIGTLSDKMRIARLRLRVTRRPLENLFQSPETSTSAFLRDYGFSANMVERFFRPFLGGIFLERELQTSSHMFEFVFRMFSLGDAALPATGMGAMAEQLLSHLPAECVRFRRKAVEVRPDGVTLASGEELKARIVVVATDPAAAAQLLPQLPRLTFRGTTCFYFSAEKPPISEPMLVLNGEGQGPVNNLCVPSLVAPSYAPSGSHLISATVVGNSQVPADELLAAVRQQLTAWFGRDVQAWRHLRTDWIPNALPTQTPSSGGVGAKETLVQPGLYVCGDHRDSASINGALASGRRVAEAIVKSFGGDH
jgi:phytoene dehydrogenase-like protein